MVKHVKIQIIMVQKLGHLTDQILKHRPASRNMLLPGKLCWSDSWSITCISSPGAHVLHIGLKPVVLWAALALTPLHRLYSCTTNQGPGDAARSCLQTFLKFVLKQTNWLTNISLSLPKHNNQICMGLRHWNKIFNALLRAKPASFPKDL